MKTCARARARETPAIQCRCADGRDALSLATAKLNTERSVVLPRVVVALMNHR